MKIDHDEFLAVARIVVKFNKYLHGSSPTKLVRQMEGIAYNMAEPGYIATAGYMLTAYNHPEGGLGVKPSVSHIIF